MTNAAEYAKGFIGAIIGVTIATSVLPTLKTAVDNVSGSTPILAWGVVGTVVGASILFYLLSLVL